MKGKIYKKIVVEVGITTLVHENGKININRREKLVRLLADLKNGGKDVILVTSGALGVGTGRPGIQNKKDIKIKQALAAVGQGILMQYFAGIFFEYGITVARILLTRDDLEKSTWRQNALNTLKTFFSFDIIPIINENETVVTDKIAPGGNDTLSALVSKLIDADILIILSDIDGLYTVPPDETGAKKIPVVERINPDIEALVGGSSKILFLQTNRI